MTAECNLCSQREWRDILPKITVEDGKDKGLDRARFPVEKGGLAQGAQTKDPLLDHANARVSRSSDDKPFDDKFILRVFCKPWSPWQKSCANSWQVSIVFFKYFGCFVRKAFIGHMAFLQNGTIC